MNDDVTLRPVLEADLSFLHDLTNDPSNAGGHDWFGFRDPGYWRRLWEVDGLLGADVGRLLVVNGADRLGFVSWFKVVTSRNTHCWNMGIMLMPGARGHGYGTRAQRLLVRYLFAHTLVNRIDSDTEITNIGEQRALEKAGFTREGVIRGAAFRDGQWHDGVRYSILRAEVDLAGPAVG